MWQPVSGFVAVVAGAHLAAFLEPESTAQIDGSKVSRLRKKCFNVGNTWEWVYSAPGGEVSSFERYSVVGTLGTNPRVIIEMSTKFDESSRYVPHHRFEIDLAEALSAAKNRSPWKLSAFWYIAQQSQPHSDTYHESKPDVWLLAPHRDNTIAFEEKFDVSTMLTHALEGAFNDSGSPVEKRAPQETTHNIFQPATTLLSECLDLGPDSKLLRPAYLAHTGSQYVSHGPLAGVAALKRFGSPSTRRISIGEEDSINSGFTFRLLSFSLAGAEDPRDPIYRDPGPC